MKNWYVYILRCKDNSLYTGITNNIQRRYEEHKSGKGARYTKIKGVEKIEIAFTLKNRSEASKIEYFVKRKNKKYKESLVIDEKEQKKFIKNINEIYKIIIQVDTEK
jgi:putative endonuclease